MQVRLNSDQQAALEAVKRRENIFLSGPAGSGKSTLVAAIVAWATKAGLVCDVTAMTGCAALLLGSKAKTLHSWAGIGLGRGTAEALATDILKSAYAKKRWKRADILIVDEISMIPPDLFEKLSQVGKRVRGGTLPWGGLQLILCGDFYQLPPVSKEGSAAGRFAFESPAWAAAKLTPVLLSRIERQTDQAFQKLLNEARVGRLSEESIAILKSRQGLNWREQMIRPTLLFSKNADVDTINQANLAALEKPIHIYEAKTIVVHPDGDAHTELPTGELLERLVRRMDADSSYVPKLELCEGCQVMLVYNMSVEKGLVNGSRGVVVGFRPDGIPVVQFLHGDPVGIEPIVWESNDSAALIRLQIPLRVAYAVTIHKSQGATLDCALVDIGSSTFECGQAYVALSRVRDLESLYVWNFQPTRVKADPKVDAFYQSLLDPVLPSVPPPTPVSPMSPTHSESVFLTDVAEVSQVASDVLHDAEVSQIVSKAEVANKAEVAQIVSEAEVAQIVSEAEVAQIVSEAEVAQIVSEIVEGIEQYLEQVQSTPTKKPCGRKKKEDAQKPKNSRKKSEVVPEDVPVVSETASGPKKPRKKAEAVPEDVPVVSAVPEIVPEVKKPKGRRKKDQ